MSGRTRFLLVALLVAVFSTYVVAAPYNVSQSTAANQHATGTLIDEPISVPNELDEIVLIFDFEIDDLSEWTWGSNTEQDPVWSADGYSPRSGDNSWRNFDPSYGGANGGYQNHWFQSAVTPPIDLTGTTSPELSFWFKLHCEEPEGVTVPGYDGWDGANFWIRYTDGDEVVTEVVTDFTGTAYDGDSFFSFGYEWFMGVGIPAWGGHHDWSQVTVDLSAYTDFDDVQIIFTFCSDPAWDSSDDATYTGYQIDDIEISDGETVLFADGAEDPDNSLMTFEGGAPTLVDSEFQLLAGQNDAPSPVKVLDVDNVERGYSHYMESPEFSLPGLEAGERLFFDLWVNSDMFYDASADYYPSWTVQVWDPEQEVWWNVNNIRGIYQNNTYVGPSSGWSSVTTDFGSAVWEATPIAGLDGVKMRVVYSSAGGAYAFEFCRWDNFTYEIRGVQHDIATRILTIPYPVAVGLPNPGSVLYSNNGIETETFLALWGVNIAGTPGLPGPNITLDAGEEVVMTIDTPGNSTIGWVPTAAQADLTVNVIARANLATDEDLSNNFDTTRVYVNQEGDYEFGYDNHTVAYYYTMNTANTGPMTRFVMDQTNPYFSNVALDISDLGIYWYARDDTRPNWPAGGVEFTVHVFAGGTSPGEEWHSEVVTVDLSGGNFGWVLVDLSEVEELQGVTAADFYVWMEVYTAVSNGSTDFMQPSIIADLNNTGELYPGNNLFYNGVDVTEAGYASFIHVMATESESSLDEPVNGPIPASYALEQAYPNPFNPTTTLRYDMAQSGRVSLKVYNVAGQLVATLLDRDVRAGSHTATFNASALSSGVYFVQMEAGSFSAVQKVMLMK